MNSKTYKIFSIVFLFFLSGLLMFKQIVSDGYFSCIIEDTYTFTSWGWQFIEALKEGIVYPRWMPLNSLGYGSPTFIIYPPLAYYLVAFFNMFTGSVITAMNITKFLALFLCGVGMFFLVKEFYSERVALLTASFYIVFPYQIFQFYYVGTFASTISFVWFAPIMLFTYRYIKQRKYGDILYAGSCYAGLILTHLINAYMFTFVLVAFITVVSIAKKEFKDLVIIVFVISIGNFLSAAYLFPVIYEKQFVNMQAFITGGYNFSYYFILPDMTQKLPPDSLWPVIFDKIVFFISFFAIFLFMSFTHIIKIRKDSFREESRSIILAVFGIALWSLFLLFGVSRFIWETVPFFKFIQFPYRWLNITTFTTVFISAVIFFSKDNVNKLKGIRTISIVLLFLICFVLDYKYIDSAHMFAKQSLLPAKPANLKHELPIWVDKEKIDRSEDITQDVAIKKGKGIAAVVSRKSAERVIEITAEEPLTLRIRTFNFPGWKAFVDNIQVTIKTEKYTGAMIINTPKGSHTLVVKFEDTPIRYYAKLISVLSLVSIVILISLSNKMHKEAENDAM